MRKIENGEFSIIGENAFFKGVNMQTAPTTNSVYITQLIELVQYYKASMYNELGLNANYNMKRERLNLGEVSMNVDVLLPYVDNMLKERQNAVEKINEMFDTEISVKLSSSWGLERDNYNALAADLETAKENPEPTDEPDPTEETTETDGNDTETDGNDTETEETEETKETETETDGNDTETEETEETEENEENKDKQ